MSGLPETLTLKTNRLTLRPWRDSDIAPFAAMCADPDVMRYFPATMSAEECQQYGAAANNLFATHGYSRWAVETAEAPFIGFVGLRPTDFESHFTPCVEIGWRLAKTHWGKGYATEGARAVLTFGFKSLALEEIVSFTPLINTPSIAVMKRLGMTYDPQDDFDIPSLSDHPRLQRCALYRMKKRDYRDEMA